ncbi:phosphoribosylglycinamide formyltransferase [Treponema bryantii]|uniref:phosphoribosylglycinamide formyltransferase n=1 Tax=Treponema bryantii TaxID=163 RepID=UPI0003B3E839|nr:phosphoribosylglycinamide formyltransferase [Treponema bryantii]
MLKTAVLVSGGGTNLQALIDYQAAQAQAGAECPYEIVCVISDSKKAFALERAAKAGIPTAICSPYAVMGEEAAKASDRDTKRLAVSNAMLEACRKYGAQAIVEAGCLTVLAGDILKVYENKIINLHPALLPKFGGVGMFGHHVHEAVIAAGEKESGCTIHIADGGCDTGRILIQKRVPVMPDDTPDTLYARIAPKEHEAIVEGLCMLANNLKSL